MSTKLKAPETRNIPRLKNNVEQKVSFRVWLNFHILLCDVLQDHVDVDVEPAEGANELLVPLHDHPDLGPDASVDQLCSSAPTGTCTIK